MGPDLSAKPKKRRAPTPKQSKSKKTTTGPPKAKKAKKTTSGQQKAGKGKKKKVKFVDDEALEAGDDEEDDDDDAVTRALQGMDEMELAKLFFTGADDEEEEEEENTEEEEQRPAPVPEMSMDEVIRQMTQKPMTKKQIQQHLRPGGKKPTRKKPKKATKAPKQKPFTPRNLFPATVVTQPAPAPVPIQPPPPASGKQEVKRKHLADDDDGDDDDSEDGDSGSSGSGSESSTDSDDDEGDMSAIQAQMMFAQLLQQQAMQAMAPSGGGGDPSSSSSSSAAAHLAGSGFFSGGGGGLASLRAEYPGKKSEFKPRARERAAICAKGTWISFGRFELKMEDLLEASTVTFRYANNQLRVRDIPKFMVSPLVKNSLQSLCKQPAVPITKFVAEMGLADKAVLERSLLRAHFDDQHLAMLLGYNAKDHAAHVKETVIRNMGMVDAGNDSPVVKADIYDCLNYLLVRKQIVPQHYNEMVRQIYPHGPPRELGMDETMGVIGQVNKHQQKLQSQHMPFFLQAQDVVSGASYQQQTPPYVLQGRNQHHMAPIVLPPLPSALTGVPTPLGSSASSSSSSSSFPAPSA